jgi:phosphoribosyl 1,2-cyclic phosphodiesterase
MLKFCSLYSGSSGNSLLVQSDNAKILVDAGVSGKKIIDALTSINVDISEINAIIVSHEHSDHIKALRVLSNKYNIPVFANKETWAAMPLEFANIISDNIKYFELNKNFYINDLEILPFPIPHDAANPCGFNIFNNEHKISIATDIGNMNSQVFSKLENSSFILLESNYDPEVLKCSSYPYPLKERIAGPSGHLPNYLAGQTISKLIDTGLKSVMLGHLSKENNFPELAYQTVLDELSKNNLSDSCIELNVASRYEPSKIIEIA